MDTSALLAIVGKTVSAAQYLSDGDLDTQNAMTSCTGQRARTVQLTFSDGSHIQICALWAAATIN
jgi:hypothetical protein